jgi:hypothetical protein
MLKTNSFHFLNSLILLRASILSSSVIDSMILLRTKQISEVYIFLFSEKRGQLSDICLV